MAYLIYEFSPVGMNPRGWYHLEIWAAVWYKRGKRVLASGAVAQVSHGSFKPGSGVKLTLMMLPPGLSLD
jgi:hypothetical protein